MTKCLSCDKEYNSKRATSKFCSTSCRKRASRSVTKLSVTDKEEVSVTEGLTCTHSEEKHLTVEDWKDIIDSVLPAAQYYKMCNKYYDKAMSKSL